MSLTGRNRVIAVLAALALALPLAARGGANKGSKSIARADVELTQDATLAGKQVKAGTYVVRASESTLTLLQKGKVVAEAPIQWNAEPAVSSDSVVLDSGAVIEVHFAGKMRYARVASESEPSSGQK